MQKENRENERKRIEKMRSLQKEMKEEHASNVAAIHPAFKFKWLRSEVRGH